MNPVPLDLISFARIPKRERIGAVPQYRIYIRGVPGGLGEGYTDVLVMSGAPGGWYLAERAYPHRLLGTTWFHPTRAAAVAELHLCEAQIPANVREYLAEATP